MKIGTVSVLIFFVIFNTAFAANLSEGVYTSPLSLCAFQLKKISPKKLVLKRIPTEYSNCQKEIDLFGAEMGFTPAEGNNVFWYGDREQIENKIDNSFRMTILWVYTGESAYVPTDTVKNVWDSGWTSRGLTNQSVHFEAGKLLNGWFPTYTYIPDPELRYINVGDHLTKLKSKDIDDYKMCERSIKSATEDAIKNCILKGLENCTVVSTKTEHVFNSAFSSEYSLGYFTGCRATVEAKGDRPVKHLCEGNYTLTSSTIPSPMREEACPETMKLTKHKVVQPGPGMTEFKIKGNVITREIHPANWLLSVFDFSHHSRFGSASLGMDFTSGHRFIISQWRNVNVKSGSWVFGEISDESINSHVEDRYLDVTPRNIIEETYIDTQTQCSTQGLSISYKLRTRGIHVLYEDIRIPEQVTEGTCEYRRLEF